MGDVWDEEVFGEDEALVVIACDEGEDHEGGGDDDHGSGGEAIHTVGEINGIGGTDDDENGDNDKSEGAKDIEVGVEEVFAGFLDPGFNEGNVDGMGHEAGVVGIGEEFEFAIVMDENAEDDGEADLEDEFFCGVETFAGAGLAACGSEFEPIVEEADGCERDGGDESHDDVEGGEVCEAEDGGEDCDNDEEATHCGGVGLLLHKLVEVGVVELGIVADFLFDEPENGAFAEDYDDEE